MFTIPSASSKDPKARLADEARRGSDADWNSEEQCTWAQRLVGLSVAKPTVQGVFWLQWRDDEPHDFSHGGLWDDANHEKPALSFFRRFRRRHLA